MDDASFLRVAFLEFNLEGSTLIYVQVNNGNLYIPR